METFGPEAALRPASYEANRLRRLRKLLPQASHEITKHLATAPAVEPGVVKDGE